MSENKLELSSRKSKLPKLDPIFDEDDDKLKLEEEKED